MIPKITQDAPNIVERYWCADCGHSLPNPKADVTGIKSDPWRFCPGCGAFIEYDKAEQVHWSEQSCIACGRSLIYRVKADNPYFMTTFDFVAGSPLCRSCLEEHCVQTNCLQCDIGNWPDCRYAYIKRHGLQKAEGDGGSDA